jgi:hypothetical protein
MKSQHASGFKLLDFTLSILGKTNTIILARENRGFLPPPSFAEDVPDTAFPARGRR